MHTIGTSMKSCSSVTFRRLVTLILAVAALVGTQAQVPIEKFRGTVLNEAPASGITSSLRGSGAFAAQATEKGLLKLFGEKAISKLKPKKIYLRVGNNISLPRECTNESIDDAEKCTKILTPKKKEGPFEVVFGPGQPAMPDEYI